MNPIFRLTLAVTMLRSFLAATEAWLERARCLRLGASRQIELRRDAVR